MAVPGVPLYCRLGSLRQRAGQAKAGGIFRPPCTFDAYAPLKNLTNPFGFPR